MKSTRLCIILLLTFIASLFSLSSAGSNGNSFQKYEDPVNDLVFQAFSAPDDSYEIRYLLAEVLGYEGSKVQMDLGPEDVQEFIDEVGVAPSQLPVLEMDLVIRREFRNGSHVLEYERVWLRLSDG